MISSTLGAAFLYVAAAQGAEPGQVADLQEEIHRAIDAESETELDGALAALRARADEDHGILIQQLFRFLRASTSTAEAMAFGAIREALSIRDEHVINALVPLLETDDEEELAALGGVLSEFEGHSPGGAPDFAVYEPFLRAASPPRGLLRHMNRIDPNAASLALRSAEQAPVQSASAAAGRIRAVTDAELENPSPDDWLMWRRTLDGWGYSPLDQIDRGNVGDLRMVWSRGLGPGLQQGTPLVHDGVMYMPNPRDVIQAIDGATGDLRWEYRRDLPDDLRDYMLGALTDLNRNLAIYGTHIIDTSGDDYVFALDAATGELAWETQILDYRVNPANQSSGPIIADGKIVSGRGCTPRGGPNACVIVAHDAVTGEELWRRRTIPAPGEPGDETWGGVPFEERKHVGAWMVPSYDPELNLVYIGTSVTSPAPKFLIGGADLQHLYHNSTLALDADTGEIVWYYQHLNDSWDLDHPFERILVDTAVSPDPDAVEWINPRLQPGEVRRVMTGIPGKTGIVYTLDRATGEFLWARPTVAQNVVGGIDGATGAVSENQEVVFRREGQEVFACPTLTGGKDWEPGAYSPLTNAMYFPLRNACARIMATNDGSLYGLGVRTEIAPGTDQVGTVQAISAETGELLWIHEQRAATSSLLATGGGLVFGGDYNGRFRALDHETGEVLWEINIGSPVTGFPVTYAHEGRQYVAVSTGRSLTSGAFNRLTPELRPSAGNTLFVFALGE